MKFNLETRKEFRELIKKKLQTVEIESEEDRIKLDTELLEELMFENVEGRKIPVWTGEFLSKLDLSEVSFANVCWSKRINGDGKIEDAGVFSEKLCFANTNIKVDFTSSAYPVDIIKCDFSNVDLSNSNITCANVISDCNLSNTKIKLEDQINKNTKFINVILDNNDLSNSTINFYTINLLDHMSIRNTRIQVIGDFKDEEAKKSLREMIQKGMLEGCYVNGALIESDEVKKEKAQLILEEYKRKKEKTYKYIYEVFGNSKKE